ncbi:nuclease domain-containing protein [Escherichia coli]
MANLRKEARGRECQVRIYGVCNGNPETTVLAHYRMAGICGTGMKPDDLIGAWACSACHDEIDRRTHNLDNILKGLLDSLIHAGFAEDDEQFDDIRVIRGVKVPGGRLGIKITELENA